MMNLTLNCRAMGTMMCLAMIDRIKDNDDMGRRIMVLGGSKLL